MKHEIQAFLNPPDRASEIFEERLGIAEKYAASLASDGVTRGLIGPREVTRLWERHIMNCAVLGELLDEGCSVADIGSGAGLPGIPLAIARPDIRVTLIEPLLRRTTFLEEFIAAVDLTNVTVIRGRAEEKVTKKKAGRHDVVTSRAVAALDKLAAWSAPLIQPGGDFIALKGASAPQEIIDHADALRRAGLVDVQVLECGVDLVDVPTTVVRATRVVR